MEMKLLLATDLLKGSHHICLQAQSIAKKLLAKLSIIHVVETPLSAQYAQALGFAELIKPSTSEAKVVLETLADELEIPTERQYVFIGKASYKIIECARVNNFDGIIIGSHAHTALPNLLGSTANTILHKSHCNVFTLRADVNR